MKVIKKIVCLMCILTVGLTGCSNKKVNSNSSSIAEVKDEKFSSNSEMESSSYESDKIDGFSFSSNLNVFYGNEDSQSTVENKISIKENKEIKLTLLNSVQPDATQPQNNIPLRIYLFADNNPIPFALDNGEYSIEGNTTIDALKEQYNTISFKANKNVGIYNIVCIYFPEDIPERGLGEYGGVITYSIVNQNCNSDNKSKEIKNYIKVEPNKLNYGIDIGTKSINNNDHKIMESHYYNDVNVSKDNHLYLKFNSGSEIEMSSYYLMLLVDGKLTKFFDNDYLVNCNCKAGKRSFQYAVKKDLLGKNGLHTFQLIAVPSTYGENMTSFNTSKIRVNVQL